MNRDVPTSTAPLPASRDFEVFAEEGVVVVIWKRPPVIAGIRALTKLFEQQHALHGVIGHLAVIEEQAGHDMEPAVRKELARQLERFAVDLAGTAIAFTATGFIASVIRSVVFAITATGRVRYPMKIEQDVEVCTTWLADQLRKRGVASDPDKLNHAVHARRSP